MCESLLSSLVVTLFEICHLRESEELLRNVCVAIIIT